MTAKATTFTKAEIRRAVDAVLSAGLQVGQVRVTRDAIEVEPVGDADTREPFDFVDMKR